MPRCFPAPMIDRHHRLTGNTRYRAVIVQTGSMLNRQTLEFVVLQVEEEFQECTPHSDAGTLRKRWRDARISECLKSPAA